MRLALRRVAPVIAALVVCAPLLRAPEQDSYPLSTYPMFASDRGALHSIATAVRVNDEGVAERLSPQLIAGTDEVVLASVTVERAVARGEAAALCEEILDRFDGAVNIEVRQETLDVVAFVVDDVPPRDVEVHATCGRAS